MCVLDNQVKCVWAHQPVLQGTNWPLPSRYPWLLLFPVHLRAPVCHKQAKRDNFHIILAGFLNFSGSSGVSLVLCGAFCKVSVFTRSDFLSRAWCFFSFWLWKSLFSLKPGFLHRPLRFRFHSLSLHEVRATLHIHGPAVKWEGNASSRLYNYLSHKAHSPFLGHDRCIWTPPRAWWRTLIPCPNSVMWLIWVSTSG